MDAAIDDPELYCTKVGAHVHEYARAVGHAALGEVDAALEEEALYHAADRTRARKIRTLHNTIKWWIF